MKDIVALLVMLSCALNSHSQIASRLVAFATYYTDTTSPLRDTGIYNKYSMDRGGEIHAMTSKTGESILSHDFLSYHEGVTKFDSAFRMNYLDTQLTEQFFDESNNVIYARRRLLIKDTFRNLRTVTCKYYNNNLLEQTDTIWTYYGTSTVTINQYTYDFINNPISYIRFTLSNLDTTSKTGQTFFYDKNNTLISICTQYWYKPTHSFFTSELTRFFYTGNQIDSTCIYDVGIKKNVRTPYSKCMANMLILL